MFEPCSCSAIWNFVCEETLDSEGIGESTIVGVGVQGLIMVRLWRETHRHGSNCALGSLRYQGLVRHGVLRSCVVEWWKEGDDDGKGIGGVDEVNESDTIVVVDGDCRWKKDGRWLHSEKMQHRRGLICKQ